MKTLGIFLYSGLVRGYKLMSKRAAAQSATMVDLLLGPLMWEGGKLLGNTHLGVSLPVT